MIGLHHPATLISKLAVALKYQIAWRLERKGKDATCQKGYLKVAHIFADNQDPGPSLYLHLTKTMPSGYQLPSTVP